jgi:hypothetical protein
VGEKEITTPLSPGTNGLSFWLCFRVAERETKADKTPTLDLLQNPIYSTLPLVHTLEGRCWRHNPSIIFFTFTFIVHNIVFADFT